MGLRPTSPTRPLTPDCSRGKHSLRSGMWQKFQNLFSRDEAVHCMEPEEDPNLWAHPHLQMPTKKRDCSSARPIGIGLPRQATFKRQNSEKRERLCPVEVPTSRRRAQSSSRATLKPLMKLRSTSLPSPSLSGRSRELPVTNVLAPNNQNQYAQHNFGHDASDIHQPSDSQQPIEYDRIRPPRPASVTSSGISYGGRDYLEERSQLNHELDTKWILNLSMHFRDRSDREKFFVTYAETPTRWRRVTVSCDYRLAEPGSIELDLRELQLQRDKSMQIYEAIRDSLPNIKFYDTVTNLKLETTDGRLHVHVTEDVNEIIPYPPIGNLAHILHGGSSWIRQIRESELSFQAHLSGFVYKVLYQNRTYIKKEIPGPDTVDEFLYEVNALHDLRDSRHIIDLEAIVTDDEGQVIKGLLISYAEQGAVVDLLYDHKGEISWEHREKWARHAIQGLSEIHEEGYVQGDFTLSNIVVDANNNACIIDINRRGCPVGWEPPEIAQKIASSQRISMYIGEKSDIYQLGMTLWALAMDDDEPERHDPPLSTQEFPSDVPLWYQEIVRICLSMRPRDRLSATDLLKMLPQDERKVSWSSNSQRQPVRLRPVKQYIDPAAAVERDDIARLRHGQYDSDEARCSPQSSRNDLTYTWPQSSNNDLDQDSNTSEFVRPRGRRRISDHDTALRAQRQHESMYNEQTDFDNSAQGPQIPIISISSDGTQSHVPYPDDPIAISDPEISDVLDYGDFRLVDSPPMYAQDMLSDRAPFQSHSDVSDNTPRNSSLQLIGAPAMHDQGEIEVDDIVSPVSMPDDLAGLGCHPSVSSESFEQFHRPSRRGTREPSDRETPSLLAADSGYGDSLGYGLEDELEMNRKDDLQNKQETDKRAYVSTGQPIITQTSTSDNLTPAPIATATPVVPEADCEKPMAIIPKHFDSLAEHDAQPFMDSVIEIEKAPSSQKSSTVDDYKHEPPPGTTTDTIQMNDSAAAVISSSNSDNRNASQQDQELAEDKGLT